jgi:hypothetical protein
LVKRINKKYLGLNLSYRNTKENLYYFRGSDQYSYYLHGIPAIKMGNGNFPEHHTPNDDVDLIDFNYLKELSILTYHLIQEIANLDRLPE